MDKAVPPPPPRHDKTNPVLQKPTDVPCISHIILHDYYTTVNKAIQRRRKAWTAWKNSETISCDAAYLCLQQEHRRSRGILRAKRLSFEWKLANSAKTAPKTILPTLIETNTHPAATPR